MSGSAREQGPSARGHQCVTAHSDSINARSPERATDTCAFLLTLTYMDVANPEIIPFSSSVRLDCDPIGTALIPRSKLRTIPLVTQNWVMSASATTHAESIIRSHFFSFG